MPLRLLPALLALTLAGCPSYSLMQSSRTLAPGQVAFTGGAGTLYTPTAIDGLPTSGMWQAEGAIRVGVLPNLDLGLRARLNDLGVRGDLKVRVLNLPSFQIALAPGAAVSLWPYVAEALGPSVFDTSPSELGITGSLYHLYFPVILGIPIGGRNLVFLAPQLVVSNWRFGAPVGDQGQPMSVSGLVYQPGIALGLDVDLMGTRTYPEVNVHFDPDSGTVIFQFGIAASFELGGPAG